MAGVAVYCFVGDERVYNKGYAFMPFVSAGKWWSLFAAVKNSGYVCVLCS